MNETLNTLKTRRSCRNFSDKLPSKEDIEKILEAGTYAPTGKGKQSPTIICITNKEVIKELAEENRKIGGWDEEFNPFYNAPVVLLVVADKSMFTYINDGSLVAGNLMNAAASLNISSIWIHRAKEELETEIGKKILKDLNLENVEGIANICIGYSNQKDIPVAKRKEDYIRYIN